MADYSKDIVIEFDGKKEQYSPLIDALRKQGSGSGDDSGSSAGELKLNVQYTSISEQNFDGYMLTLDKTSKEIDEAFKAGKNVYFYVDGSNMEKRTAKTGGEVVKVDGIIKNTLYSSIPSVTTDPITGETVVGYQFKFFGGSFNIAAYEANTVEVAGNENGLPYSVTTLTQF